MHQQDRYVRIYLLIVRALMLSREVHERDGGVPLRLHVADLVRHG
jgi:hypothetical protein